LDTWKTILSALPILALVGGFAKWWLDQRRMRIHVSLKLGRYRRTRFEWSYVDSLRAKPFTPDLGTLERLSHVTCYVEMELVNTSKKTLKNITLTLPDTLDFGSYEVDEKPELHSVVRGEKIALGDLQPRHKRMIYFWLMNDLTERFPGGVKAYFQVSAEEIDKVHFKLDVPGYVWGMVIGRSMLALVVVVLIAYTVAFLRGILF
jgi:hypothetical protein